MQLQELSLCFNFLCHATATLLLIYIKISDISAPFTHLFSSNNKKSPSNKEELYLCFFLSLRVWLPVALYKLKCYTHIITRSQTSLTFFLYIEVAFKTDGTRLSVLLRCLSDPLHQLVYFRPSALKSIPCLRGRGSKRTLQEVTFGRLVGMTSRGLIKSHLVFLWLP